MVYALSLHTHTHMILPRLRTLNYFVISLFNVLFHYTLLTIIVHMLYTENI